jgi:hypothetical protein
MANDANRVRLHGVFEFHDCSPLVFAERLSAAPSVHAPNQAKKSHHLLFSAAVTHRGAVNG